MDKTEVKVRIDKWLWSVRIFKSRTLATEAVEGGKVKLNGQSVKPSKSVNLGDVLNVRLGYIKKTYKVLGLIEKRISADKSANFIQDITPEEDKIQNKQGLKSYIHRYKGKGRPTKKERRTLDRIRI